MSTVIDASALIAFLHDEPGAGMVESVLSAPERCFAHALNLCEVYYDFFRASNQDAAEAAISDLLGLGIEDRADMDAEFWRDVGALKAVHRRVSLADCCALAFGAPPPVSYLRPQTCAEQSRYPPRHTPQSPL